MKTGRFTKLETERLLLRRLRESDLVPFLAYRNDPEVARYQDWEGCTEAEARGMILGMEREEPFSPGEWFQFAVELKETGKLVGDLGFRVGEDGRQAEVGYTLVREHWGEGYATEAVSRLLDHAFGELGLHRIYAIADRENAALCSRSGAARPETRGQLRRERLVQGKVVQRAPVRDAAQGVARAGRYAGKGLASFSCTNSGRVGIVPRNRVVGRRGAGARWRLRPCRGLATRPGSS